LFEFPDKVPLKNVSTQELSPKELYFRDVVQDILSAIGGYKLDEHLVVRMISDEDIDRRSLQSLLMKMNKDVTRRITHSWNSIFHRKIVNKEIIINDVLDEFERPSLEFQLREDDDFYRISERSLGFRWFFVFLLLTQYRGFRDGDPSKPLFLFDEPASNLHQLAQQQLLKSFETLLERCSIIYTTHSHHLINPLWLENTFIVKNVGIDYDAESDIEDYQARDTRIEAMRYRSFVNEHPTKTSYFQPILDVLDYRPSSLEMNRKTVLVEGKTDYYSLSMLQRDYWPEKLFDLVPAASASSLEVLISLYFGWAADFVVLLDDDKEGRKQKERYLELFGAGLRGRILTYADISSEFAGREVEDLFPDSVAIAVQKVVATDMNKVKRDKKVFARGIQEVIARKIAIP